MALIESWVKCELSHAVQVQYLQGNLFSADNQGNLVGVRVFENGEPASISGSVSANVIRADGTTVPVAGTLTNGNECYVILPQAAYAVTGVVTIVIKITASSVVTTLAAIVSTVYASTTDAIVDPGTIIPSIETLIAAIEAAVATIPADYSSLWATIAPAYTSLTFPVSKGQYCTNNGHMYRAKQDIATSETFTSSHWEVCNVGVELFNQIGAGNQAISELKSALNAEADSLYKIPGTFINTSGSAMSLVSGGIKADGTNNTMTTRSRTQLFEVKAGYSYLFELTDTDYYVVSGYGYSANSYSAMVSKMTKIDDNHLLYHPDSNVIYARLAFAITADNTQDMTDSDRTAILSALKVYTITDETLSIANAPADAKATGDIKTYLETLRDSISDEEIIDWSDSATESYPQGWAGGYYNATDGDAESSNVYIRSNSTHFFEMEEATLMEVFAPTGYAVRAYEYKPDGTFVETQHGSISDKSIGSHFFFEFEKGNKFRFAMGRFNNATDSENHYTDGDFLATCVVKAYTLSSVSGYDMLSEQIENISTNLDAIFYTKSITFEANQWRTGYYKSSGESAGSYSQSLLYICTKSDVTIAEPNMTRLVAKAPDGYYIAVHEYTNLGVFVKTHGNVKTTNEVNVATEEGYNYRLSIGRFGDKSASAHLTDAFIGQIQVSVDELKIPSSNTKLNRTGDYEFFKVTVDRPLSFGGEEVIDSTKAEEVQCVLRLPTNYTRSGTPTRLILMAHGAGGKIDPTASVPWYAEIWNDLCDDLLAAGYALFDSNIFESGSTRGRAIGSPLYVNVLKKAYDYIVYNYNVYDKIFAHGTSMGGVGATAFSHIYPDIVLAESSFAGRSFLRYLAFISGQLTSDTTEETDEEKLAIAKAYGYESVSALNADKFSHAVGCCPELSLIKYVDGVAVIPPDRVTDFQNWMEYYTAPELLTRSSDPGIWMGKRIVPYKAWNSYADGSDKYAMLEVVLASAYNRGNSCPYYAINYESGNHSQMSFGTVNDMRNQLISWYKRWE